MYILHHESLPGALRSMTSASPSLSSTKIAVLSHSVSLLALNDWETDIGYGILAAGKQGATHLWANTMLFSSHPLQTLSATAAYGRSM